MKVTAVQLNLENGGLEVREGAAPSRERFEMFLKLLRSLKDEYGLAFALLQEARYYDRHDNALLREVERETGMIGYLAPALRAEQLGQPGHHTAVWIDPEVIRKRAFYAHGGGQWWHSAAELRCEIAGVPVSLISAHLHVASAPARMIEAAALAMMVQGRTAVIGADFNSARADGRAQNLEIPDRFHRGCRSVYPAPPGTPALLDRGASEYLVASGLIAVHEHVGTPAATAWTVGHRPNQQRYEGGGSQPDHVYVTANLADGTYGKVTECVVLTEEHWPDAHAASDHLATRFAFELPAARNADAGHRDAAHARRA